MAAQSDTFLTDAMAFFRQLTKNNNRDWFNAHRHEYEAKVKMPGETFEQALSAKLTKLTGAPVCGKTFRIHRDVRFSKDKTPYNVHLRMAFREEDAAQRGEMGCAAAYMLSIEADRITLGGGSFEFPGTMLDRLRAAIADDKTGNALDKLLAKYQADGMRMEEPELKRVPAPYAADHPRGNLLRRKTISIWRDLAAKDATGMKDPVAACAGHFKALIPLNRWLADL